MKTLKYVSGNFEGNFFTYQKSVLSVGEKIPDGGLHNVHVYKGELTEVIEFEEFKPEEHLNRDGMLLHNVTNIQITPGENSKEKEKKIYDFDQLVIKNVEVVNSWEADNKTYGILKGELVGKVKKISAVPVSHDNNSPIPPPPIGGGPIQPPPVGGDNTGWNKYVPPIITNNGNDGCFSSIWRILKWLLLLLLILFLLKQCKGCGKNNDNDSSDTDCYVLADSLTKENKRQQSEIDSLNNIIFYKDSICNSNIERERLQCEIDNLSSEIYFYIGSTKIREYSENKINKIVELLNNNSEVELEILGYHNGSPPMPEYHGFNEKMTIDKARALTVKQMLVNKGIDINLITAKGMGESTEVPSGDLNKINIDGEEILWNLNMRVEIKIVKY
jgi:outer membrane protein OmpA-like peptidoglycan-associated protein